MFDYSRNVAARVKRGLRVISWKRWVESGMKSALDAV